MGFRAPVSIFRFRVSIVVVGFSGLGFWVSGCRVGSCPSDHFGQKVKPKAYVLRRQIEHPAGFKSGLQRFLAHEKQRPPRNLQ